MQTLQSISGLQFPYNFSRSNSSAASSYVDIGAFPIVYNCSTASDNSRAAASASSVQVSNSNGQLDHHHHHHQVVTTKKSSAISMTNGVDQPYDCSSLTGSSHSYHYTVHGSSVSSLSGRSNSATDTSSVGSRTPDFLTPVSSPQPACAGGGPTSQIHLRLSPPVPSSSSRELMCIPNVHHHHHQKHHQVMSNSEQQQHASQNVTFHLRPDHHHHHRHHLKGGESSPGRFVPKPFTIEAILGLDRQCPVGLSLDLIVSTERNATGNSKRKHVAANNVEYNRKTHANSGKDDLIRAGVVAAAAATTTPGADGGDHGVERRSSKCKRVRTIFTPEQLERLEGEFERQQYMVGPERLYLAASLNLTEAQVKVWFQNRRIKWRKQHLELQQAKLAQMRQDGGREPEENHQHADNDEMESSEYEEIEDS